MKWIGPATALAMLSLSPAQLARAQSPPNNLSAPNNPLVGNPDAIRAGTALYRARCADCHGMDARGVRAPDLTEVWASGRTDGGLFRTLRNGIPGTEMPAVVRATDDEVWKMLAYLRTLAAPAAADPPTGNVENGQRVFQANCAACHRVNGLGGRLGPDLSRIGASRSRAVLERQIVGAVEGFRAGYEPVTLTPRDGPAIHGVKKNEDLFSVQIMDTRERIQGYVKEDMREVKDDARSVMPAFQSDRLNPRDLNDVLRYLSTLRGSDAPAAKP